jgi:hypothetical protein
LWRRGEHCWRIWFFKFNFQINRTFDTCCVRTTFENQLV